MPPRRTKTAQKADSHDEAPTEAHVAESSSSTVDAPHPSTSKGKAKAARHQPLLPEEPAQRDPSSSSSDTPASKPSMLDRQARLSSLRAKLHASTRANRRDILSEQSRSRTIASDLNKPSYSRKLAKASTLLEERDLREAGEDVERHRNMSFSLEDSERWDNKLAEKAKRKDQGPGDFSDAAERAYQRQVRLLKPNLSAYEKGKEERDKVKANSPATGALVRKGKAHGEEGEGIHYGTHRPSDDAIDRVVQHLNHEKQIIQNRSRRRAEDPDSEVNYINDGNKHFNKKLKRFYDGQTKEIRENLERGTAL